MIALAILLQAAATTPTPVAANVQLACTLAMPGGAPAHLSIDLQTKKPGTAALVTDGDGPFSRVGASSDAVSWPGGAGAVAFAFATGVGQYRVELTFAGDPATGDARARIVALGAASAQPLVAQGFCTARPGKRLAPKALVRMPFDASRPPSPPLKLGKAVAGITRGDCRVVTPDRRVHTVGYAVLSAVGNEANVAYHFDDAALVGAAQSTGIGVQFHLVSPTDHLVAMTLTLPGQPAAYIHTTFERSGNWIDITRGGAIVAQGECGAAIPAILAPAEGNGS